MSSVRPTAVQTSSSSLASPWKIKLLYDGDCPLCLREVRFLKQKDAGRGIVNFVDIAAPDYTPAEHGGVEFAAAMGVIHGVLPDGTVLKNVAVFRRVYEELGMGWVYALTKLPIISAIADTLYRIWAAWRLKLTGRPDLATILAQRSQCLESEGRCRVEGTPGNAPGP